MLRLEARCESWPLKEAFTISRGSKTVARVIVASVTDGAHTGRGEAVPYARYGETPEQALAALDAMSSIGTREELQRRLPAGAARNALDCALWDYEAKHTGTAVAERLGCGAPEPVVTAYTLSLGAPESMAAKARSVPDLPLLKLKLGGAGDDARMRAVRAARPDARLIVDANEAWLPELLSPLMEAAHAAGVELIEQPLPAGADTPLADVTRLVPVCADESLHTRADIARIRTLYDAVNIKLDKTGGLTEAVALKREAQAAGLKIMIGSMVATSLAVAPAFFLAQGADWTDLDGPLLIAEDREHAIRISDGVMYPPSAALWG